MRRAMRSSRAATKTLKAGTYKWIDAPNVTVDLTQNLVFSSAATDFTTISLMEVARWSISYDSTGAYQPSLSAWTNPAYQTITLATDQQVSADFYDWAITGGNLVKQPSMPVKGDIITLDSKQYRVLKTEGTVAEVLAMYDASTSVNFDSTSNSNNIYAGKSLDTYCNSTFYSGLSAAMKAAIVDKTFTQDSWNWSSSVPTPSHYTGKYGSSTYYLTLGNAAFGTSITRHCYVLSVQDVLDYLGATTSMGISDTTLTNVNIWKMFWNQTTSVGASYLWLRSAYASYSGDAFRVSGNFGRLDNYYVDDAYAVRPAFQIDLSKISWS